MDDAIVAQKQAFTKNLPQTEGQLNELAQTITKKGYVEVENVIEPWVLEEAKQYLLNESKRQNTKAFSIRWSDMEPCILTELQQSPTIKRFLGQVLKKSGIDASENDYIHHVVRCTNGTGNKRDAFRFHFDQYNITMLMPIAIPDIKGANCGDLIIFPNCRKFNSHLLKNLIHKLLFQNNLTRKIASFAFVQRLLKAQVVKVKPGNVYLFYGYRSYHGNMVIDENLIRITGIFHYNDPLSDSQVIKEIENCRPRPQDRLGPFGPMRMKLAYLRALFRGITKQ